MDYDSDSEGSRRSGRYFRVGVNEEETIEEGGAMELNLSGRDLEAVKGFALRCVECTADPGFQPLKCASWSRMRTLLGRIVSPEYPRLWEAANRPNDLGSYEFRRSQVLAAKKDVGVRASVCIHRDKEARRNGSSVAGGPYLSALPVLRGDPQAMMAGEAEDVDLELRHGMGSSVAMMETVSGLFERLSICDDESFFPKFKDYLGRRGRPPATADQRLCLIADFSRYNRARNERFSLARLCRLFHEQRREEVLLLPRPWNWLECIEAKNVRDAAHCAYNDLLDFLVDLLVLHRGRHISAQESVLRQQHLQAIEREVLGRHPYRTWSVAGEPRGRRTATP